MTYPTKKRLFGYTEKTDEFRSVLLFEIPFPAKIISIWNTFMHSFHNEGSLIEIEIWQNYARVIQAIIQAVLFSYRHEEGTSFQNLWSFVSLLS
jgi:hypothetical protein